jgi:DNA-binding beta-propeller fold protein YncE
LAEIQADIERLKRLMAIVVDDGGDEQVKILDHASGKVLSSFGRPGHQTGEFIHGHTLAVDSKGNVYVAETDWGRTVQKFEPVQ